MTKRIDGLIPTGKFKRSKGPAKELKTYSREPMKVSAEELNQQGAVIVDGLYKLLPVSNTNKCLLQANYWIANNNQFKARNILKGLGMRAQGIKRYIDEEIGVQKRRPELSGFNKYFQMPMPEELELKDLN
tara:strand:+ start:1023 stop:1415 length:393 start_codon:yes stop_codon:yes gene_type:complete